ncbi:MAG: TIGR00730 family Rossman fold protein [Sphingobacteriales bacterium]|nr:MAG: TIGR00730 family Rossman fold protein [Sphingobacteriales bacterium]
MNSVVVFCGSSDGYSEVYHETAFELGAVLATRGMRLIYGGARIGLMGAVADGCLQEQGQVIGVIPGFLKTKEVAHEGLSELIETESMHERKLKMHELSDGIIALPGGWGTMEELFEMMTWAQLGLHPKPIGILNVNGFYDPLLAQISMMTDEGFLKEVYRTMIIVSEDIHELLELMNSYTVPDIPKWITKKTT